MRKRISGLMAFVCLLVAAASALAAGTTVTTFTPFADMDFAAQGYMDLITAWEDETGNMVEDYSGLEDDLFMQQMHSLSKATRVYAASARGFPFRSIRPFPPVILVAGSSNL